MSTFNKFLAALSLLLIAGLAYADGPMNPGGSGTAITAGQLPATTTNDNACATCVGFESEANVASPGSNVTSGAAANVTSLSLGAGDWIVAATIGFNGAASTTVGAVHGSISLTTANIDQSVGRVTIGFYNNATVYANTAIDSAIGPLRFSFASTTSVFLNCQQTFGVSTASCFGNIRAWHPR